MKHYLKKTILLFPLIILLVLFFQLGLNAQGSGEVIITEYHNRPAKPTQADLNAALPNNPTGADTTPNEGHTEWFEIYNTTPSPVVMDGWILIDASNSSNISIISSFTIQPFSYAVFSGFNIPAAQGGVVFDYFYDYKKPSFNNESSYADVGDTSCPDGVIIQKGNGTLVDEVLYDYGYGNYIGNPNSGNCSMNASAIGMPPPGSSPKVSFMLDPNPAVMNSAANDNPANWSFSTLTYDTVNGQKGTPGEPNGTTTSGGNGGATCPSGNLAGFIQDLSAGDTGELRYRLPADTPCGTMCASVNLDALATEDGFVNLSGSSTTRANAVIDFRIKDGSGTYEFTESGASQNAGANFPAYAPGNWADICIDWNAPGVGIAPDVTVTIDGVNVAGTFPSEGASISAIENGVRNIQFRFAGSSATQPAGIGFYVDDISVVDCNGGTIWAEDFESNSDGDILTDPPYHENSSDATAACSPVMTPPAGTGQVIITEIHNRPCKMTQDQLNACIASGSVSPDTTPDEGQVEWFEVYNTTASPVVMDGWTLTDGSSSSGFSTIGSFTIQPFSYAVFAGFSCPAAQGGMVPDYVYSYEQPSFNNESSYADPGDTACPDGVTITDSNGTLVDEVLYDYGYGEYINNPAAGSACNGPGTAIGLPPQGSSPNTSFMLNVNPAAMNAAGNDMPGNWSYSTAVYDPSDPNDPMSCEQFGTPGEANDFQFAVPDCAGVAGGTAFIDDCGMCVGGSTGLAACAIDCANIAGGTAFIDACGTCVGGTTGLTACVNDCNGDPGGTAFIDGCGACVGGNTGLTACVDDCNGDPGGTASIDDCGNCVGGNTGATACVTDCAGVAGGTAFTDDCGNCVGGNTGATACVPDCAGVAGGTAFTDDCGNCVGGNTGATACVPDCAGVPGGTAFTDDCGNCVGGSTGATACVTDCAGVPGGTAFTDDCGNCVGGNTGATACITDCAGVPGGSAFVDGCGDCVGGTTGLMACANDCTGLAGGTAFVDDCGDCVGGNTGLTACAPDCAGVPGGTAFIDDCQNCVGGTTGAVACVQDCSGVFGGTAFTDGCGDCVGGNTGLTACASDCAGVAGGTATVDACGDCVGGTTGMTACVTDCAGTPGGTAMMDGCGNCVGGTTGQTPCVADCNGDLGGSAFLDGCGDCVGGNTGATACSTDCAGVSGGSAVVDDCGNCVGGTTGMMPCATDCAGVAGGSASIDDCGNCVGGNTGQTACVTDCNGDLGGSAFLDGCGDCVGGNTGATACSTDCAGVSGGTAYTDDCGNCVGGTTGMMPCAADCAGVPGGSAVADCNGDCNGTAYIDDCNNCVGGNTGQVECDNGSGGGGGAGGGIIGCGDISVDHDIICFSSSTYSVILTFGGIFDSGGYTVTLPDGSSVQVTANAYADPNIYDVAQFPTYTYSVTANANPTCTASISPMMAICTGPTAIEIAAFNGVASGKANVLSWTTASEQDNSHFTLYRSSDGQTFEKVADINSQGNSTVTQFYEFSDFDFRTNLTYYKLVDTDYDGTSNQVSKIVAIEREDLTFDISNVYPVPSSDFVTFEYVLDESREFEIKIYDLSGRQMSHFDLFALSNDKSFTIDIADYPTGSYFVSVTSGDEIRTIKFLKD